MQTVTTCKGSIVEECPRPPKEHARAALVLMPEDETGACIVCAKEGLGHGSWCYGCGSFVCTTHDTTACLPIGVAHTPYAHARDAVGIS